MKKEIKKKENKKQPKIIKKEMDKFDIAKLLYLNIEKYFKELLSHIEIVISQNFLTLKLYYFVKDDNKEKVKLYISNPENNIHFENIGCYTMYNEKPQISKFVIILMNKANYKEVYFILNQILSTIKNISKIDREVITK